jgi:hypothetical protein
LPTASQEALKIIFHHSLGANPSLRQPSFGSVGRRTSLIFKFLFLVERSIALLIPPCEFLASLRLTVLPNTINGASLLESTVVSNSLKMPRRDFIRDLREASSPGRYPQLRDVKPGDDDGTISFTYVSELTSVGPVDVQLLISGTYCFYALANSYANSYSRYLVLPT